MKNSTTKSNWYCKYKIAHRGLHNDIYPENSLGAFDYACQKGFAIELDVHTLKDGNVAVFHDQNTLRLCGKDQDIGNISTDELKDYKLLKTKYTIPTLKEVLELVDGRVPIMIERKPASRKEKLVQKTYDIIKDYKGEIAVKSFNPFSIMWFKKHANHIPRGLLSSYFEHDNLPRIYKIVLKKLLFFRLCKPDFISYNINNLPNKYVTRKNVPVITWTVNNKELENKAFESACNIVFENYVPEQPLNY